MSNWLPCFEFLETGSFLVLLQRYSVRESGHENKGKRKAQHEEGCLLPRDAGTDDHTLVVQTAEARLLIVLESPLGFWWLSGILHIRNTCKCLFPSSCPVFSQPSPPMMCSSPALWSPSPLRCLTLDLEIPYIQEDLCLYLQGPYFQMSLHRNPDLGLDLTHYSGRFI